MFIWSLELGGKGRMGMGWSVGLGRILLCVLIYEPAMCAHLWVRPCARQLIYDIFMLFYYLIIYQIIHCLYIYLFWGMLWNKWININFSFLIPFYYSLIHDLRFFHYPKYLLLWSLQSPLVYYFPQFTLIYPHYHYL